MFYQIIILIIGIILTVLSISYIILYSNIMKIGYSFDDYLMFLSSRYECWLLLVGILLIIISIYFPWRDKDELYK
jgi:hypothetical protein